MFEALKKYADFDGRARRKEFWLFYVFIILGSIVTISLDILTGTFDEVSGAGPFTAIFIIAIIVLIIFTIIGVTTTTVALCSVYLSIS